MQSLHFNNGSIKLTRERATMVSRWECNEVARWVAGLAGIQPEISEIFLKHRINGSALSTLLRDDLIRMGINKLDQQLILMQSIDNLLTLINRLNTETLAVLFMRVHHTATTCYNLLKRFDEPASDNSHVINSPEFYTSISNLSNAIVETCHWLGRLPFIENVEYAELRGKIIKALVQIRLLMRNMRLGDQINMPKSKLILEIGELRTTAISLVRQNKDSLFSSDCYLTRVNLRRPTTNDVNIEYTTMPDFTHVISSIETEAVGYMGSGFSAMNIGDEIIEINNQVVIGWDPAHFKDLIRSSSRSNEICLLVKKMPRHNDDEIYTKRIADLTPNPRRQRARGPLERIKQAEDNRTRLLEQDGEIDVESDDETLYQSKRSSQIKRDQHSSLPDLTDPHPTDDNANDLRPISNHNEPSSSISTTSVTSPNPSTKKDSKHKGSGPSQSSNTTPMSPSATPKSSRKMGFETLSTLFRSRQDPKSVIPETNEHTTKDQPQLVNVKRLDSLQKQSTSTSSIASLADEQTNPPSPMTPNKHDNQREVQSPSRSSISNIFKSSEQRAKQKTADNDKHIEYRNENKTDLSSNFGSQNDAIVANKPPLNHSDIRKSSAINERRRPKRKPSYRKISCKDLGKGDCEGVLHRYLPKAAISILPWRRYWCVLKGGTLYIFKQKDDKNQEVEIKLEGKNVSPTPERRKYAFRIADEGGKNAEYFCCSTRDEMAKWMNKMGLAAINFNIDDSRIGGFHKGFVDSREGSPASTPILGASPPSMVMQQHRMTSHRGSIGESENDSDKESTISWHKSLSHHSSVSDTEQSRDKNDKRADLSSVARQARSSSSTSILSDTHNSPIVCPSNRFVGQINALSRKGHHRTSSSPINYLISNEDDRDSPYVHAAPRLSDSDSSSEFPCQRLLIGSQTLKRNQLQENCQPSTNDQSKLLNSSGGFASLCTSIVSPSNEMVPQLSVIGDDEISSRKVNHSDPLPILLSPSSSIISLKPCSPAIVRAIPLYVSVYTSTPSIPLVKGTLASSAPTANDDELHFARRSPSPTLKKQ